jgi:prepilin-type N-terminal cleavage/methylation domain-containing protein
MRRDAGFTLLELMLAMFILVMVTAICYGAFFTATRVVAKGEIAVVTAQRLRVATDVIIRQLKSAVPYPARNEDEEVYPFFRGQSGQMTFITANGRLSGGGLARVQYTTMAGDGGTTDLVLQEDPYFGPDELGAAVRDPRDTIGTVVLSGFRQARFQYLLDDGADLEWRDMWDAYEEDTLPAAVRIVIEGMPGLETDVWGQEVPIMVATYGEANGEVDEEDLASEDLNGEDADLADEGDE